VNAAQQELFQTTFTSLDALFVALELLENISLPTSARRGRSATMNSPVR
jgi:hypothetical protein